MVGIFGPAPQKKPEVPASISQAPIVQAAAATAIPVDPPRRSSEETASLAAQQTERYTRRKGRAVSMLTGGAGTSGGVTAGRMLGSVART